MKLRDELNLSTNYNCCVQTFLTNIMATLIPQSVLIPAINDIEYNTKKNSYKPENKLQG